MTESMCPWLHRVGLLLQNSYHLRDNYLSNGNGTALALAECNLCRVHEIITLHRSLCPLCLSTRQEGFTLQVGAIDRVHTEVAPLG
jgi:hypothetical protein